MSAVKKVEQELNRARCAAEVAQVNLEEAKATLKQAQDEVKRLEKAQAKALKVAQLEDRREELLAELAKVEKELTKLGAGPSPAYAQAAFAPAPSAAPAPGWKVQDDKGLRDLPEVYGEAILRLAPAPEGVLPFKGMPYEQGACMNYVEGDSFTILPPQGGQVRFHVVDEGLAYTKG